MYGKILVPIDGSTTAARGMSEAIALGKAMNARLRVLHVMDKFSVATAEAVVYSPGVAEELKAEAEKLLESAKSTGRSAGLDVDTVLVDAPGGRPVSDFVAEQVDSWGAQLIVLGTHGRRGIRRLVLGSDAEAIVRRTTVPVLLVRAA